ncbi:MAG: squalene/phytoene synthase family protein [Verrucomicrobiota bacterium]
MRGQTIHPEAARYERELGRELLASVSRSFYLSLRVLPAPVRGPMSLSYLLARASDTIADASEAVADPKVRIDLLDRLGTVVNAGADERFFEDVAEMLGTKHHHAGEAILMSRLRECHKWLSLLSEDTQKLIREVLRLIFEGQRLDLERFEVPAVKPQALSCDGELDEYTYLVAGSVGEFWTAICQLLLSRPYSLDNDEMRSLAVDFGKGLQLINIIRDCPKDLATGRCYLPVGDSVNAMEGQDFQPHLNSALKTSSKHLQAGMRYVEATNNLRLRFAAALPLALALKTSKALKAADWATLEKGVKVSRPEVKALMKQLAWRSLRRNWIGGFLDRLAT